MLTKIIRRHYKKLKRNGLFEGKLAIFIPYAWFICFLIIPFAILLKISFADLTFGMPPYSKVVEWVQGNYLQIKLNFGNYFFLFSDDIYYYTYFNSVRIAFFSTLIALLVSYPFAYAIYKSSKHWRTLLIMLVVLPFYTSFLIRVYAWIGLLGKYGLINSVLQFLKITQEPIDLLYNDMAVCFGIVYCYLPFMIIPIYVALQKMDTSLLEAAYDLGCKPWRSFLYITLPLTKRGIAAGSILIFVPATGEFVLPELLGGANTLMIGRVIWNEFFQNRDWPIAACIAITMFILVVVPLTLIQRWDTKRYA